jgi:asparagine synthase (glutamine-hydrolysing)
MCGIVGHLSKNRSIDKGTFQKMIDSLTHRGPDGEGMFISSDEKRALGHRRLSFLDLSSLGKQPMANTDATIWISFNGEIYNYLELKAELKGRYQFVTGTDTEVILAAYQVWGLPFVTRLKGMFAIALLDEKKGELHLIRDRFGIKPLYYGITKEEVVFASELKAIIKSNVFEKKLNKSAVADYFVYRYVPSPKTIWEGIHKLSPASYITVNLSDFSLETKTYWELSSGEDKVDLGEFIEETDSLLRESVKEHLRADVPIGSFLSGGYDSSALAMWMSQQNKKPETFSIGFQKWEKSEHFYAKIVSDHLGLENNAVVATDESLELVELMAEVYDEPIADISIVPTFMVSRLARTKVKAVFSGEGADELFGGYTWQHEYFNQTYNNGFIQKAKNLFRPSDPVSFYARAMAMGWFDEEELKKMLHADLHSSIPENVHWFYQQNFRKDLSPVKAIQHMDIKCFMGELVLTKIDRASMANSLEVRVPFLDHDLFEKFFKVDERQYLSNKQTKKVLYETIKKGLPNEILDRKKQGFVGPDNYYMNLDFYKRELQNSKLVEHKIINKNYIEELLKSNYDWKLWKILVFEKWFAHWLI